MNKIGNGSIVLLILGLLVMLTTITFVIFQVWFLRSIFKGRRHW